MRKPLLMMGVALVVVTGFTAPAQATVNDVLVPFSMSYGNSTTTGKINFTDGYSASVSGVVHAASDRRMVCAYGVHGGASTVAVCSPWAYAGGPNQSFSGPVRIPRPGGVQQVVIMMQDQNYAVLAQTSCTRNGCTREI
jgi:hypothetical protein